MHVFWEAIKIWWTEKKIEQRSKLNQQRVFPQNNVISYIMTLR